MVGTRPSFTRKKLASFRNDRRLCRATWLPRPRKKFVPQGLAVAGTTAWLAGYRYARGYGSRPCTLMNLDLRTGGLRAYRVQLVGAVGDRGTTYCRHGGGVVAWGKYLWIVEKNKLWLVDPMNVSGHTLRATRVWRIQAPVRGSAVLLTPQRIGLVPFQKTGRPEIHWFDLAALRRRKVLELGVRGDGGNRLGAAARTPVPTLVQGATIGPDGGIYLARSNLSCGELVTPSRRRIAFMPGAEGISFSPGGTRLWVSSESGAIPYVHSRKPLTPAVSSYEWPGLLRGRASTCRF